MITGFLTKDSPLRAIWPNGLVPLARPGTVKAILGAGPLTEDVYLLALSQTTPEQREAMAARLAEMGQGTIEEARKALAESPEFPIRASHISGCGMPLWAFI